MSESEVSLTLGPAQLYFTRRPQGGLGYGFSVTDELGHWRKVSAASNPLVCGSSFNLFPNESAQINEYEIRLNGNGAFNYAATVRADPKHRWFHFDVELDLPGGLQLSMIDGYEPEIMLDLGTLPPYERGDHVWFMTHVANPTKWNDDAYGNDLPATYLFDSYLKAEFMMFFDFTAMSWMSMQNTGRFLNYRCGYKRRYQPKPAASLGLYLDGFCGKTLPPGKIRFAYSIAVAPKAHTPTDREAVQWLVERSLPLLPSRSDWPEKATNWREFSRQCADDLMTDHAWHGPAESEYLLNYVDAYSPAWQEAIEARGGPFDMDKPCLESGVWGAHPLAVLQRIDSHAMYSTLYKRMVAFINRQVLAEHSPLALGEDLPRGTWQHFYIVEQMFQVARCERDEALLAKIKREVDGMIVPFTRKMNYFLPLSFDNRRLDRRGSGNAHALLGTYASFMLDLYEWTGDASYLNEAKQALRVLYQLPINTIHQEIFMLAMGVHAAARLTEQSDSDEFGTIGRYLLAQTLRMMHWFDDRTGGEQNPVHTLGMFQACATISYPAIFENIETLARIAAAMNVLPVDEPLLRIFDHARKNNFYFFPLCQPSGDALPLKYVPLENIWILEGPKPASVGAEIYGAGWVFRAHLLWEALGRCTDREIMVLNCSSFDERRQLESGKWDVLFYIFNSTTEARDAEFIFPIAVERNGALVDGAGQRHPLRGGRWKTKLAPGESRRINVIVD